MTYNEALQKRCLRSNPGLFHVFWIAMPYKKPKARNDRVSDYQLIWITPTMKKQNIFYNLLAMTAGAALVLAFAPFGYYLIAELSLVTLLFTWHKAKSPGQAFWRGWLFGLAFFGWGAHWVYISIHNFGHAPIPIAALILAIMVTYLALYPAITGYLLKKSSNYSWLTYIIIFPFLWVSLEWVRGWMISGFPWLFLGYGHINSAISSWATVFGVYGISFVIAQTAGAVFCIFLYHKKIKPVLLFITSITTLWGSGYYLNKLNWTTAINKPIQVSLIQGNISLEQKWDETQLLNILNTYSNLTTDNFTSKIIVWPEAAIPAFHHNISDYLAKLAKIAQKHNTTILSGIMFQDKNNTQNYYNGIIALGANSGRYYKRHLVPFGEYMPLKSLLSWLRHYLDIPMSGFSSGSATQPKILIQKTPIAPFVCYEIAYPGLVLDCMPQASLIVTVCDDSWFGESIAAAQHLEIAQMRSLEVGRYQLLTTSTGITAIIDAKGKVLNRLPEFKLGVLTGDIQLLSGATPWVKLLSKSNNNATN